MDRLEMQCPVCQHINQSTDIFCGRCGSRLVHQGPINLCTECGTLLPLGSRFCGHCGTPSAHTTPSSEQSSTQKPVPPAVQSAAVGYAHLHQLVPDGSTVKIQGKANWTTGERREVTVLFVTIYDFQNPSQPLDSENAYLITDEAMRLLVQIVHQFEGTVDKFTGPGLMALFGAPITHENDPERAVQAALAMLDSLKALQERYRDSLSLDFQAQIGVNTGLVIAGNLGSDLHMEYTVIGDTVNLAARIQGIAAPGTALVSHATFQRTRGLFDFHSLPPVRVKGKPEPIHAYQLLSRRTVPIHVRGLTDLAVPMVGRQEMVEELVQAWQMVAEKKIHQTALIRGDAGLGKSRLVAEVRQHIEPDALVYQANCLNYTRSTPFWLLGALLRDLLKLEDGDAAQVVQDRILHDLQTLGLQAAALTPYILSILGVAQPSTDLSEQLAMMDIAMLQQQTHVALHQVIRAKARQRPFVLILEDIHWIDSASRNFLIELLRSSADLPILIILVFRAYEQDSTIQSILTALEKDTHRYIDLQLKALSADQEYLLIDQLLSSADVRLPMIHRHIARRAEGNPFYIEEIVRMLLDKLSDQQTQAQESERDSHQISTTPSKSVEIEALLESVPPSLGGLILARFDSLGEQLRRVLQLAAVIDRSFSFPLFQRLVQTDDESPMEMLNELVDRHFLIEEHTGSDTHYSFRHALVQETVYGTLLHKNRRQVHGTVAAALRSSEFLATDELTESLAYHHSHSEQPTKAIPYLVTAAQNSTRRSAYESSLQFYRRALALFPENPSPFSHEYGQIHIGLGTGLKLSGEFEEAQHLLLRGYHYLRQHIDQSDANLPLLLENLRELADVCQRAGNFATADRYMQDALALAEPLTESPLWYTLIERRAWIQFRLGDLEQCSQLAREAILHLEARPNQQPFTLASFYNTLGGVAWQQSNLSEAVTYVEGSLKIYELHGLAWGVSVACVNLGVLYWTLGQWAAGTKWYERAAKIQEENGFSFERATSLRNLGYLRLAQGDTEIAYHHFKQSLALCLQHGHSFGALTTHLALATWAVVMDDGEELSLHRKAAQSYKDSADTESSIGLRLLAAQDLAYQGDFDSATHYGHQALQMAAEGGMHTELVEISHAVGVIYRKAGNFEKAEHYLMTAQRLAEERNSPDKVAHAQLELAILYAQMIDVAAADLARNWRQDALKLVRTAIASYERLGARLMLERSRSLEGRILYESIADESWRVREHSQEMVTSVPNVFSAGYRIWPSTSGLPNGEKKKITVLWLTVRLSNLDDEEDIFDQTTTILSRVSQIIDQNGGHIIRHPDGVAATFGAPIAHQDDHVGAINCATQIASFLNDLATGDSDIPLYHMGLERGDAIVGYLNPQNDALLMVTGEPMVRAEWLAQRTPAGSIWLSQSLAELSGRGYCFRPLDSVIGPRGDGDQIVEFVSAVAAEESRDGEKKRAKLIGRETALEVLLKRADLLDQQKESGFVWLEGEAGIGKSRLLNEFYDRLRDSNHAIWRGSCSSQSSQQPFRLFSTLINDIFGLGTIDSSEEQRKRLQTYLDKWIANSSEVQPYLELLCDIAPASHNSHRLDSLAPEALHRQIFVAVRSLLVGIVQQHPLILVLDDLHWLDPVSANLLVFLAQMAASMPVLFVLAQRPIESEAVQERLNSIQTLFENKTWRINLTQLSWEDSHLLLSNLLPSGNLSPDAHRFILERSNGNPYYLEEFLQLLIEQGHLHQAGNIWVTRTGETLNDLPLPATLEALIRSRVDSLSRQQRQLLQLAAVIGRPFPLRLFSRIMSGSVDRLAQELSRRNLLTFRSDNNLWQFHHHIAQMMVYNSMLRVRLKALHGQVASALEDEWGQNAGEHAEELAHHFSLAEENERALHYLILAGRRAEARYTNDEALSYYQKARDRLRSNVGVVADKLQWQVSVGLGDAYRIAGNYELSIAALEEGLALLQRDHLEPWRKAGIFRRLGQTRALQGQPELACDHFHQALALLQEPTDRDGQIEASRILYYLAYTHFRRGQWENAKETCELCYSYAQKSNDLSELAAAENLRGGIAYQQGERVQAMHHTENALHLRERAGYTWGVASTMGNLAILAGENGEWDRSKRYFLRSLDLRHELGDTEGIAIVNNNLGWLNRIKGRFDEAQGYFRESLRVAELFKMVYHVANAMLGIGHIYQLTGKLDEAQQMIDASHKRAMQVDAQGLLSEIHRVQAEILLDMGVAEEAEVSARRAEVLAAETNSDALEAEAWRVISECQFRQGLQHEALESIKRAYQSQPKSNNTIECGRVALQAGRLLYAVGRLQEAEIEFDAAYSILSAMGAEYDLTLLADLRSTLFIGAERV